MSRLRFGVIGCGVIGGLHARVLNAYAPLAERARLVAVASPSPERAHRLAEETGSEATDIAALIERSDIDVISVCTPSGLHAELGLRALAAGKHVVVEKPIDVSARAADRLIAGARQAGRALAVISQRRFDPASRTLRSALDAGEFGTLTSGLVEVPLWRGQSYYDSGGWRGSRALDGGGALLNQGVHAVDLVQWLMGPVVEVAAHTALKGHRGIEVEDVVTASLRHASGALTSLLATTAAYPGRTTRLTVHGDRGSAVIDNDELTWFHAAGPQDDTSAYGAYGAGNQAAERRPAAPAEQRDASGLLPSPHGDQLLDLCDAIAEGRTPAVDGEEGRRALLTVLAVYEAARTGAVTQVASVFESSPTPSAPMTPEPA
ncbi:Gfo/Idh/MocA family protein [Streptomyces sp. HF10]|uniref:Gfo/Idh/MocA family protein n=1 Tax=Streptomyces sp. HF10 TaxID=2692233 RepID=UPI001318AADC|nr:Gfo/Idh/MocA family oxidoreductase [Streptomyces sp. HF10]QHC27547.1 Gfo/Idh/MocA family oxidoreductase [Streptomyces sp. HF10]